MPLYEYKCDKCGTAFEELVAAEKKDDKLACPNCGSTETKRQFSSFAIGGSKQSGSLPSCAPSSCSTGTCPYV